MRRGNVQSVEAIVLRKLDYAESDQIIGLLTHEFGKVSAFAAGAKKSVKRFGGGLDLFACVQAELRPPSGTQSHLWRLQSIELKELHLELRKSLERYATAAYFSDCLWSLSTEGASKDSLYDWWKGTLSNLSNIATTFQLDPTLDLELLSLCGYAPSLSTCIECGNTPRGHKHFFSFQRGGVACEPCRKVGEGRWIDSDVTRKLVKRIQMTPTESRSAQQTIDAFFSYTLGTELKSQSFRNEVLRAV